VPWLIPSTSLASIPLFLHRHVQLPPPSSIQSLPLLFGFLVRPSSVSTSISILSHMPSSNISLTSLCNGLGFNIKIVSHQVSAMGSISGMFSLSCFFSIPYSAFCFTVSASNNVPGTNICALVDLRYVFSITYIYIGSLFCLYSVAALMAFNNIPGPQIYVRLSISGMFFPSFFFWVPYSAFTAQRH